MSPSPNPFADEPLPERGPRLESAGDVANPYAAPVGFVEQRSEQGPGVGIWQHRDLVVIHRALNFPERCIWTNEPATDRWSSAYSVGGWHGIGTYSVRFAFSLSASARRKIFLDWLRGAGLVLAALLLFVGAGFLDRISSSGYPLGQTSFALGMCLLIVGLVVVWWHWRPLSLVHHHGPYFVLHGAKRPFLRSLPHWPGVYASGKRSP